MAQEPGLDAEILRDLEDAILVAEGILGAQGQLAGILEQQAAADFGGVVGHA